MKRLGFFLVILVIAVAAHPTSVSAVPKWAPDLIVPNDSTVELCLPDTVCLEVSGSDVDAGDMLTLTVTGAIEYQEQTSELNFTRRLCFDADTAGVYVVAFKLNDTQGHFVYDTTVFTVTGEYPPEINDQHFSGQACYGPTVRTLPLEYSNPSGAAIIFDLLSGPGSIDQDGVITYEAIGMGVTSFEVAVSSECGADTAMVTDTVILNEAPYLITNDTSLGACGQEQICIDIIGFDPEGSPLSIGLKSGEGTYTPVTDTSGMLCFVPAGPGEYEFVFCVADICPFDAETQKAVPFCHEDTVRVTVLPSDPPVVSLGDDIVKALCALEEVCLSPVTIDGDVTEWSLNVGTYDPDAGTVCFAPDTAGIYEIILEATDVCGVTGSDTALVTIQLSSPPVISNFDDQYHYLCYPTDLCLEPVISDPDGDLDEVTVEGGSLLGGRICFVPYGQGEYTFIITATDTCGNSTVDTAVVTIETDEDIALVCPEDTTVFLCDPDTIGFHVDGIPEGADVNVTGTAVRFDDATDSVFFYSDCCLENTITVSVTTECGTYSCSFTVSVQTNSPPLVALPNDTSIFACDPTSICLPAGVSDIDGNRAEVAVSGVDGAYYDDYADQICFSADASGEYTLYLEATDSCGVSALDSVTVTVALNRAPFVEAELTDTTVVLCGPEEVCIDYVFGDIDGKLPVITSSLGTVGDNIIQIDDTTFGATLCFELAEPGEYDVVLVATDECGVSDTSVIAVTAREGTTTSIARLITSPKTFCTPTELCFEVPVTGYAGDVSANFGIWQDDTLCFLADTSGLYTLRVISNAECNSDTSEFAVDITLLDSVSVSCGPDDDVFACSVAEVFRFPISLSGDIQNIRVWPDGATIENDTLYYEPDQPGEITFGVYVENDCSTDSCDFTVSFRFNQPPEITLLEGQISKASQRTAGTAGTELFEGDGPIFTCDLPIDISIPYTVFDPDGNLAEVRSTLGVINDTEIYFAADTAGTYTVIGTAIDECGEEDKDTAIVVVVKGEPAVIECPSEPISIYVPELPVTVFDTITVSDNADSVTVDNGGSYDPATGELQLPVESFGPTIFTIIAYAECGRDTCEVVVAASQYTPPSVVCPEPLEQAVCLNEPGFEICVPIEVSGTGVSVSVSPIGTYAAGNVCFPVDSFGLYDITVIASSEALGEPDADTCQIVFDAFEGAPPTVTLPEDFEQFVCEPTTVCAPLTTIPGDFDIADITVVGGTLAGDAVCFQSDGPGVYTISVTATDACGLTGSDEVIITITGNEIPVVDAPESIDTILCGPEEQICFNVSVTDENLESVTASQGTYDPGTETVCFTPGEAGEYAIIITATDACGAVTEDTVAVVVDINEGPTAAFLPSDTSLYLCAPQEVCIPVDLFDPNDNIDHVVTSIGQYKDGTVCFVPYTGGTYTIILGVWDECGVSGADTAVVHITTDEGIALECPNDTAVFLCDPDTLGFHIGGIPEGAEVTVVGTAVWFDAETDSVFFYSDCCLENIITVTATTQCGSYSCTFRVSVQTNSPPLVALPGDTSLILCQAEEVCIPVGVSDIDGNLGPVTVNDPAFTYDDYRDLICFTPDTAGVYRIEIEAVDECDDTSITESFVTITFNSAPTVVFDTQVLEYKQCDLAEVCIPVAIEDADGNIVDTLLSDPAFTYNPDLNLICFTPDSYGRHCITLTATDECGLTGSDEICIDILVGDSVHIVCPVEPFENVQLCEPQQICVPLEVVGTNYEVTTSFGQWANDEVCFQADTSGLYEITVAGTAQCNTDECVVTVPVEILDPVAITCPPNATEFVCGPDTLKYVFTASSSVTSVSASGLAYVSADTVFVPVLAEGTQIISLSAEGLCGTDQCAFTVEADFNAAPTISVRDTTLTECELFEICIPVESSDEDNNGVVIGLPVAPGGHSTGEGFCFTPTEFGTTELIFSIVDDCGAEDFDTAYVTVNLGDSAFVACPDDPFVSLCDPDRISIPVPIEPVDAEVTILPASYNGAYVDGDVFVDINADGAHDITVIAAAQCSSDTCTFTINVDLQEEPVLSCPGEILDTLCLVEPTELCFDATIVQGTGVDVNVNPIGSYAAGQVCIPVDTAGVYEIEIIGSGVCGVDTCITIVTITADQEPVLEVTEFLSYERCPQDTDPICMTDFVLTATDVENDMTITMVCGEGLYTEETGELCFTPDTVGLYSFCFEGSDGCHLVSDTLQVEVYYADDCDVCARFSFDAGDCTPVGLRKKVAILIDTRTEIGGIDLLMSYDASALTFIGSSTNNGAASDWEYFVHRLDNAGCGSSCPSGLVRIFGLAEQNDGPNHPPDSAFSPQGVFFYLEFQVSNDQNLGGNFVPINFVWYDCGDNSASSRSGDTQYLDTRILDPESRMLWDESDDVNYPEASRPFGLGAPDGCLQPNPDKPNLVPLRCIEFINGGVCIIKAEDIDDRGDINLNAIAYEVSDAVTFTNYFIYGLPAFYILAANPNDPASVALAVAAATAASDVNADGLTLTVADLTYLIRVVVGDAPQIPKVNPYGEELVVKLAQESGKVSIGTRALSDIGAAYFELRVPAGLEIGQSVLNPIAGDMKVIQNRSGDLMRLLVYDIGPARIPSGDHTLLQIPIDGEGQVEVLKAEAADYDGRPYLTASGFSGLPTAFAVDQNYPNPFNPTTTIGFALPAATEWSLEIYNVTGALVKAFSGASEAGHVNIIWDGTNEAGSQVASGVYFYRVQAGVQTETRKMMLLK